MEKKLRFIKNGGGFYGDSSHEIVDCDTEETLFTVYDLSECPEDAIIGRDLFDGYDYISALQLGMRLAEQGYTDIEVVVE